MPGVKWHPIGPAPSNGAMPELLRCHVAMAVVAEVPRIFIIVAAAERERLNMIDDSGEDGQPLGIAPFTEPIGVR